jgi:hypothetical protein
MRACLVACCVAGAAATLVLDGSVFYDYPAGHVTMEIWELGVTVSGSLLPPLCSRRQSPLLIATFAECIFCCVMAAQNFVFRQDYQYFTCHSYPPVCDPCNPMYLAYNNCTAPTAFTLTIPYTMPAATATVRVHGINRCVASLA